MRNRIRNWLEIRIGLDELIKTQIKGYRVPGDINIFYTLGFVALSAYVIQVATGIVLLLYYIPHSDHAFMSVQYIMSKAPYGWLFRQMHVVGSNLMVAAVFFHLFSVFLMGSYKKPREMTWVSGGMMLFFTLTFCLTGYLLPWGQLNYWATTIVTSMPAAFPYAGGFLSGVLRGGDHVSGITLNRFFALHVALLPLIFFFLMGFHLFLIKRIGFSSPPYGASGDEKSVWTEYRSESRRDGYTFYPYFITKGLFMVMLYLSVMFFIIAFMPTLFLPEDANRPADPFKTPAHVRPEWYFLAPYQLLKLIPNKFLGISIELILVCIFLLWPFFDAKEERNILKRPLLLGVFIFSLTMWAALTIWGKY